MRSTPRGSVLSADRCTLDGVVTKMGLKVCIPGGLLGLQLLGDPAPQRVTRTQWVILTLGCGGLGFVGQTLLNLSFQMKNNVGLVEKMQYVDIFYAM